VRHRPLTQARALAYGVKDDLASPAPAMRLREEREVVERMLVLDVLTANAVSGSCREAKDVLEEADLLHACSRSELAYLRLADAEAPYGWFDFDEAQWALGWAVSLIRELDFARCAGAELTLLIPEQLGDLETRERLVARCRLRPLAAIVEVRERAGSLFDAVMRARLGGTPISGPPSDHVIIQRHRALAWLTGARGWDDVVPEASHWPPQRGRKRACSR